MITFVSDLQQVDGFSIEYKMIQFVSDLQQVDGVLNKALDDNVYQ